MKHNLSDVTFLIPLRVDSIFRLENLLLTVNYLQENFDCSIKIIEADQYNNGIVENMLSGVDYTFIKDQDPIFHRTKYQNRLALKADTPYIAIWEAEIIIPPHQVLDAIENRQRGNRIPLRWKSIRHFISTPGILSQTTRY